MVQDVLFLMTADCETAKCELTPYAIEMSGSGPADYVESERAIRGYAAAARAWGMPLTLFAHPEVAIANRELLLELEAEGACLGLHVHPYKLVGSDYRYDLGAYSAGAQREMLRRASDRWEDALGKRPRYFRAGYFSANDATFGVLAELGFCGGSLSNPGRVLPTHCSVWAGAESYPHRAHLAFRQHAGASDFVEVPVAVDYQQPHLRGHAGDQGFAWPYVPSNYNHRLIIEHLIERFSVESAPCKVIVLDTHNDQEYGDPAHPASVNLAAILETAQSACARRGLRLRGATLSEVCDLVRQNKEMMA
jgi:hypothetical protein